MAETSRTRLAPVTGTTRELYLFSGNRCAFEGCTEVLLKENGTWNCQIAHIYGVKPDAARGEHNLSNEELRDASNLVLMCPNHHTEIDDKRLESTYTVAIVKKMKADHEARYRSAMLGLERIVDSTAGVIRKPPKNLGALSRGCTGMTNEEIRENVGLALPFVDALVKQPPALRDVITLILVHGTAERHFHDRRVVAPIVKVLGAASSIGANELLDRAKSLEADDLLVIEEEDYENPACFVPVDPTSRTIGWDLFVEIHDLASGDRTIIKKIIEDLDFTVLDT